MKFQFESLSAFITMGGHGGFVWACYIVCAFALVVLVLQPVLSLRNFKNLQLQLAKRRQVQGGQAPSQMPQHESL